MTLDTPPPDDGDPSVARLAAGAAWHTTEWAVSTGFGIGRRLFRAAASPASAIEFAQDVATAARVMVDGVAEATSLHAPDHDRAKDDQGSVLNVVPGVHLQRRGREQPEQKADLRKLGAELLDRSRDVWDESQGHPAYERILGELAPDEGRILLLLMRSGPQPTIDVRTGGPVGMVSSDLVANGLNMIGPRAGARYVDQVPAHLNNLFRLGLIWFSREQLKNPLEYQVVEAQPDVLEAMHSVRFAKVIRRSIHLTPFGADFCRTCLVEEGESLQELPEHRPPNEGD